MGDLFVGVLAWLASSGAPLDQHGFKTDALRLLRCVGLITLRRRGRYSTNLGGEAYDGRGFARI